MSCFSLRHFKISYFSIATCIKLCYFAKTFSICVVSPNILLNYANFKKKSMKSCLNTFKKCHCRFALLLYSHMTYISTCFQITQRVQVPQFTCINHTVNRCRNPCNQNKLEAQPSFPGHCLRIQSKLTWNPQAGAQASWYHFSTVRIFVCNNYFIQITYLYATEAF
jgi:hypothetical protein